MKYAAIIAAFALASAAAAFWYVHQHSTHAAVLTCAKRRPRIVAFGDSLVAGYGAPSGQGFVDDLARAVGVPVANQGVSGDTTGDGLSRISDVLSQKPDIVIVLLGGNDALQQVPEPQTKANLDTILADLTRAHAKVVLVGVPGGLLTDPYAAMYARLAKKYGTEYVPNVLSGLLGHESLMYDQVHPNADGYRKVASDIEPALERACGS